MSKSIRTISTDGFSNLPDDVAHRVILFLSMEDISRLSVASKRCRQLCISTPFLKFDIMPYVHNATKRARLMDYIDRFLFLRKGMDAQSCCIRWYRQISEEYRVFSWLHNAVTLNVKNLDLYIRLASGLHLTLPSSLLCSTSLESIVMSFYDNGTGILKTPSPFTTFQSPSSLKELKLKSVRLDESFGTWISSYCKLLKKLSLERIKGTTCIVITSSSLEELVISSQDNSLLHLHVSAEMLRIMALDWRFHSPNNRVLQLSTPKLKTLTWTGNLLNVSVVENMKNLILSKIFPMHFPGVNSAPWNLFHVIRAACNCRFLSLYDHCIKDLFKLGCSPIVFADLLRLHIWNTGSSTDLGPSLTSFLEGAPNLRWLSIGRVIIKTCYDMGEEVVRCRTVRGRELQDLPFLCNLTFVTIEVIGQDNNELKLIEFLLKNAQNLKKMIVFFSYYLRSDFSRGISGYEKASSDAEVDFQML